ncbi:hypothetical protein LTR62_000983 [Meristemomyces frigidus]|uniref:Snf7-domain-containing protein n=1 Tax=Meristemomyces frigidus TaxID=1508187 RepID=A0AAN7T8U6_9PEZI|nr:hypothetical protein LTR62_000983 [Meristemomyces frigidus]
MSQLLEFLRTHDTAFSSRTRLASLYSDFRLQRQSNPDGYQANVAAWLRALTAAAKEGHIPSQTGTQHDHFSLCTGEELLRELQTREYGRPLSLGSVIEDAVKKKELVPLQQFMESKQSVYAKSWVPTPWEVMSWGLRQLGVTGRQGVEDKLVIGIFVVMATVQAAAKLILSSASTMATSNTSRIFSRDLFATQFARVVDADTLSPRDVSILLTHLARDCEAIAYDPKSGTVKFKAATEAKVPTIEQEDITIASLRTSIASLAPQVEQLAERIPELDRKARDAVTQRQTIAAKTALRQKKLAEAKLQQRTATLSQLEELYAKIEQAADQLEMVRVMEASSQALRSLHQKTGGVEQVQDVMEGLHEEMTNVDEIQQIINETAAGPTDDSEVDAEFEAMERVEREKVDAQERVEREEREAGVAESTRKRLAELGAVSKVGEEEMELTSLKSVGEQAVRAE